MNYLPLLAFALAALPPLPCAPQAAPQPAAAQSANPARIPKELFDVDRVVDGDTIWVQYHGAQEKLRLMCVDTEEKLAVLTGSASKPGTVFGEACALWAQDYFAALAAPGKASQVGLLFPEDREQRDAYGRLLCHVILPDGRDFNLLLVELGKSPYFNKYGNSTVAHEQFVNAQIKARKAQLGIWNPETNVPKDPSSPSVRRPYELLLPWWDARAAAIDGFRERARKEPLKVADAENPASLAAAQERGGEVDVFGTIERVFDEKNGDWTLLLRCEAKDAALRVRIPKASVAAFAALDLKHLHEDYRQNYLWVRGTIGAGERGIELRAEDPAQLRIADPVLLRTKAAPPKK
jgi:micrococcal nuclease